MTAATEIRWRVQVRKSRAHKWKNASGLYETRATARDVAADLRDPWSYAAGCSGYGFGNTRVVRHVKGAK